MSTPPSLPALPPGPGAFIPPLLPPFQPPPSVFNSFQPPPPRPDNSFSNFEIPAQLSSASFNNTQGLSGNLFVRKHKYWKEQKKKFRIVFQKN